MVKTKNWSQREKAKINETYTPKDEELANLTQVYKRLHQMGEARQKYDQYWDRYRKQWESYRPEKNSDEWQSNIVAPTSTSIVETIMSEINQFDLEPPIKPRGEEDIPRVELLKEAFKYTKNIGDFKLEEEDIKKECFILGTGFGEELLWQDKRDVTFMVQKFDNMGNVTYEPKKQTVFGFNDTYLEHVPAEDLYFDEAAKTINRGRRQANDGLRKIVMTKDAAIDFLENPLFNRRDNIQYVQTGKSSDFYQFYEPPRRVDPEDEVEILFYVCKRPDILIVVANDVLIHGGPSFYNHKQLPWAEAFDVKRTNSLYHKGEMDLLDSIQEELNKNRRMRLDRSHLSLDPMRIASRRANISEYDTIARPHGIIEVDDPDSIREDRVNDTPPSAYKEEESLNQDAVRVTGVDDGTQSIRNGSITATEFAGVSEATKKKLAMKLWHIHNGFHVSHARLRVSNILQFWTQEKYEKVIGEKNSEEYRQQIEGMKSSGMDIKEFQGADYRRVYPRIRTEGKQVIRNKQGSTEVVEKKGTFFFDVKPTDILPMYGAYDIVFDGAPEVPLTKTIMQTKARELYETIMPMALSGIGNYDPAKMTDWLVKKNDVDPDTWKTVAEGQQGDQTDMLGLAQSENQQMMSGTPIPPTPDSIKAHTLIHAAFMKSKPFQELIQRANQGDAQAASIVDAFTKHAMGEMLAQQQRMTGEGASDSAPATPATMAGVDGNFSKSKAPLMPPGGKSGSSPMGNMVKRFMGGK